jgi:hypothetical protein
LKRALRTAVLVLVACAAPRAALAGEPRREDHGALIVLHPYGTYEEMGRQHSDQLDQPTSQLRRVRPMTLRHRGLLRFRA